MNCQSAFQLCYTRSCNVSFKILTYVQIRNVGFDKTCLDSPGHKSNHHKPVGLYPCHRQGGNQVFCRLKLHLLRQYHVEKSFPFLFCQIFLHSDFPACLDSHDYFFCYIAQSARNFNFVVFFLYESLDSKRSVRSPCLSRW